MGESIGQTLAEDSDSAPTAERETAGPHLMVLLEGERPSALSSLHSLVRCRSVALGRGSSRQAYRPGKTREVDLEIQIPDLRMSGRHAIATRAGNDWILEDSSSRNGTRVNGVQAEQHRLQDGDLIELGRTTLLYRAKISVASKPDWDADPQHAETTEPVLTWLPEFRRQLSQLKTLAPNPDVSILLLGESGTGKEVLARQIHSWSKREGHFVGVNCGAIPASLVESELFGSVKGAFSGASDRIGLIRSADKGCLFLDEIADLPKESQAAVLRVLQEHELMPVGSTKAIAVDIRVLAATHQDLDAAVRQKDFRQDLFARIAGFRCILPPLRQRRDDLGLLIGRLLARVSDRPLTVSPDVVSALFHYDFPLNIRELHTLLSAAGTLAEDAAIALKHLPESIRRPTEPRVAPLSELTDEQTQHRLELIELLEKHAGNVSAIARETGKARIQIQRWLKRYALDASSFRP